MNSRLLKSVVLIGAVLSVAATTIQWYSQQTSATLTQEQVIAVENMSPHEYQSTTIGDLRDWLILSTVSSDADLASGTNLTLQTATNSAKSYTDTQVQAGTNSSKSYVDAQIAGVTYATGVITNNHTSALTFSNNVTVWGTFSVFNTNAYSTVGNLVATGYLAGPISGTNLMAGTVNSNALDVNTMLAFYPRSNPSNYVRAISIGTAAYSNATAFYLDSNPSNYASISASTNGNYLEVLHGSAPSFGVTTNDGSTFANGSGITNVPRTAISGQVSKDDEQDSRIDALALLDGGGGVATNIFSLSFSGTYTNDAYTPIYTNAVTTNNTVSGTVWVRGAGSTNAYYGRLDYAYFKGATPLWSYNSNVVLASGSYGAYVTTNEEADIVFSVKGAADEGTRWSLKGFSETVTNGFTVPEEPPVEPDSHLAENLFVFMSFDSEASATTWTNSVNGAVYTENGTLTNDTTRKITGTASIGGFTGQAANYLTLTPDIDELSPYSDNKVFVMGWFRAGETNTSMALVSKSTHVDPNREWVMRYNEAADTMEFTVYPTGVSANAATAYAETNALYRLTWYFFAGGFSVPDNEVYCTWGTTNIGTPTYAIHTNTATFGTGVNTTTATRLGQLSGGGFPLNGKLDEVAIYTNWIPSWEEIESYRTNTLAGRSYPNFTP